VDATTNEHEQVETVPDRSVLKSSKNEPMRYGHKYSWLVRLINFGPSWVAPGDLERIDTQTTDTRVAAVQVQELDLRDSHRKVIGADSRYEEHLFLGIFKRWKHTVGLIRISSHRVLSAEPVPKPKGSRGAPRKHGQPFQLNGAHRPADPRATFQLGQQSVCVQAWQKLHFKKLVTLIGTLLRVDRVTSDQCGYSGRTRKLRCFQTCVGCIFGVLRLSPCSVF
jgi:hypothetical protein